MVKDICFQCEQEDIILESGVCGYCDNLNRKNDFESGEIEITKDNIHLYYEFMSDEDLYNYSPIINDILDDRLVAISKILPITKNTDSSSITYKNGADIKKCYVTKQWFFESKDTLKPIDEYIEEIKESEAYKKIY